ncbi:DUF4091 domain-containing protein [Parabacteroides pacaensis]|uniref:DUF4091 domain-containing protein n=1 Tax=Parabacteroides pacaensis TaxID=2086575 RepID=UPI000D0FF133|nr:DUF4091 domain-containing protein [Parabacteroides pacaensis]
MQKIQIVILFSLMIGFQSCMEQPQIRIYQVDTLKKVFKEQTYFRDEVDTVCVARGEIASVQMVVKALCDIEDMRVDVENVTSPKGDILTGVTCGWVGYVSVGRSYTPPSSMILRSVSGYFPDPILPDSAFSIENNEVQPLWLTIPIKNSDQPGMYKGIVKITGKVKGREYSWKKDFHIRVYPVVLDKSSLFISNWSAHFNPIILGYLNNNEDVEIYSDLYWSLIKMHAKIMAEHRQNVHRIYPVWHTKYTYKDGKYGFDFSRFDKEVDIFDKAGALERIEGGHLAWRSGSWDSPFFVEVPLPDNQDTKTLLPGTSPLKVENGIRFVKLPIDDERTQNFLSQFLPALRLHLAEKGWLDKYMQHIADEPTSKNSDSYRLISKYVKQYLPEVKILDAVLTSKELAGTIDVWIPVLNVLHTDFSFYQDLQKTGKEIWFYTCVGPKGNYANRFIELPLIQTRLLHWINYKYNVTGYLHWGLNYWQKNQLQTNADRDAGKLPAGDNCIIYPGYRKLYTSIRFETMRDGIDDYTLLKMIEKRNPQKAKEYANSLILNFNEYDNSVTFFRKVRKNMLELLSSY